MTIITFLFAGYDVDGLDDWIYKSLNLSKIKLQDRRH